MELRAAIDTYHELLTPDVAAASAEQLEDQLRRRGLFFGDRPLATVLRPRFFTTSQYDFLTRAAAPLLRAFDKAYRHAMSDALFRSQFALLDWEEELIRLDPGFRAASPVSRLDAFFVSEQALKFTEYNAETPAGMSYNDALAEVFYTLPVMREFLHTYDVRVQPSRHNLLHALLDSYRQFAGTWNRPTIAILDWLDVPTYSEFVVSADYFRAQGFPCEIADVREVEYRDGRLYANGTAVDLIYKRVLISELVERCGLDNPITRAVRDGAVCIVNPFRCKILHKKLSLAVLSDERNAARFDASELDAIRRFIPWTRRVEERRTEFHGRTVDLLQLAQDERERMVLKPNDEYGGKGIVLGWETSPEDWQRALHNALSDPFIIQERVEIPTEPYPVLVNGRLAVEDRILDTAPFVFYGEYMDGCLTRLSTESLVNVTAGGGSSLATFVVTKR